MSAHHREEIDMRYYRAVKDGKQRVVQVPDGFRMCDGFGNRFKPNDKQVIKYLTRFGYTEILKAL